MKHLLAQFIFRMFFKGYQFPFEKLNEKLIRMNEVHRRNYYQQAREILEMEVYQDILQEGIRKFYQQLSVKANGKIDQTAYRLTLTWITEEMDGMLRKLALSFNDNPAKINPKLK